jgi:hypothetical protein
LKDNEAGKMKLIKIKGCGAIFVIIIRIKRIVILMTKAVVIQNPRKINWISQVSLVTALKANTSGRLF